MKTRSSGLAFLCVVIACSIGAVTGEAQVDSLSFGSDHAAEMLAHNVDGHDTVTILPDHVLLNGDFAILTWELAPQGAGSYTLEAVLGLGTGRKCEIFWGVDGVTNSSGELAGLSNYDVVTNTFLVTVPDGVSSIQLLMDGTAGLASIHRTALYGPPDDTVQFGSNHEADMYGNVVDGHDTVTVQPGHIVINGPFTTLTWELATQGPGDYTLEAVLGLGTGRRVELFWGVAGVTNASGELAGVTSFAIVTNQFQVAVPGGVSTIQLLLDGRTTGLASIYSSRLFGGPSPVIGTIWTIE